MDYIQFFILMATTLVGTGFVYRELKEFQKEIREDMNIQARRSDDLNKEFQREIGAQARRSDDLYKMFIDLIKETKKIT